MKTFLHDRVTRRIQDLIIKVNEHHKVLIPFPDIESDADKGMAGYAIYSKHVIGINEVLLEKESDLYLHQVIGHEFAHLAVFATNNVYCYPHGREWRNMMKLFGLRPFKYHSFSID